MSLESLSATRRWSVVSLVVVVPLLVVGASSARSLASVRVVRDDGYGVLSASKGGGENSVFPPSNPVSWYAAFGANVLCVQKAKHPDVMVTGVRLEYGKDRPLSGRALLRTVSPDFARTVPDKRSLLPDYGQVGRTAAIVGQGALTNAATLHLRVTVSCSQLADDITRMNKNQDIRHPIYEIVGLLHSDARGAVLERVLIDYTDGGRRKTLRVNWRSDMCGTAVIGQSCPAGAHQ